MPTVKRYACLVSMTYEHDAPGVPRLVAPTYDVDHMRQFLTAQGFHDIDEIKDVENPGGVTRDELLSALRSFVRRTVDQDLDSAIFYYSGHGSSVPGCNPVKEATDECLVAADANNGGIVLDDEIRALLDLANPRTHILFVADCCESGTVCDMPYSYDGAGRTNHDPKMGTSASKVVVLTGCKDGQSSQEGTVNWLGGRAPSGYMTGALLRVLRDNPKLRDSALATLTAVQRFLTKHCPESVQSPQLNNSFPLTGKVPLFL
jgi:hypothetical protein